MTVSVQVKGDFVLSIKNTKFDLEMPDSLTVKEAVSFIFEHMKNNNDIMELDDVIVALDGKVLAPENWELYKAAGGQIFTFYPPLSGG